MTCGRGGAWAGQDFMVFPGDGSPRRSCPDGAWFSQTRATPWGAVGARDQPAAQLANSSPGTRDQRLARWAAHNLFTHGPPGRCPGLRKRLGLWPGRSASRPPCCSSLLAVAVRVCRIPARPRAAASWLFGGRLGTFSNRLLAAACAHSPEAVGVFRKDISDEGRIWPSGLADTGLCGILSHRCSRAVRVSSEAWEYPCGKAGGKRRSPLMARALERWLSGRKRRFAKSVTGKLVRRFESCPLR